MNLTNLQRPQSAITAERAILNHHNRPRRWLPQEPRVCEDGEDNDVTQYLREWRAGVAVRLAVVRAKIP